MDDIKKATMNAYQKGYIAGRKRAKTEREKELELQEERRFRRQAFLAAIPFAMEQTGWTRGKEPIKPVAQRMQLAADVADEAMKHYWG